MAGAVQMTVDDTAFRRALQRFYASQNKSWPEVLRAQGRLVAVNLAYQTQPFGTDAGRQQGEGKVKSDLLKVYAPMGAVYKKIAEQSRLMAAGFWALVKANKTAAVRQMIARVNLPELNQADVGPMDGGAKHKEALARIPTRPRIRRGQRVQLIPLQTEKFNAYLKAVQKRVGMAKGGWAACAKILGGMRGIPQWVTRHAGKTAAGSVIDQTASASPSITMTNHIPWVDKCLNEGQMQRALDIQAQKMMKAVDIAMSRQAKAMGF